DQDHRLVAVFFQLAAALIELGQRNIDTAGDVALAVFVLVAHVDDHALFPVHQAGGALRADRQAATARLQEEEQGPEQEKRRHQDVMIGSKLENTVHNSVRNG